MTEFFKHGEIFEELYERAEEHIDMIEDDDDVVEFMVQLMLVEIHKLREENAYLKKRLEHAKQ